MAANVYTIFEYAANKNWGGIDALDSRTRRAKGVAVHVHNKNLVVPDFGPLRAEKAPRT